MKQINALNKIKKNLLFFCSFLFAKGVVFFVPLLLADALPTIGYGKLEYALAGLGFVLNTLLNLGVPGAYPYFNLRLRESELSNGFFLHHAWLFLLFAINQMAYFIFHLSAELYLSFNVAYIMANQIYFSTKYKSHDKSTTAIFLNSGIYLLLLLLYVSSLLGDFELTLEQINILFFLYASIYAIWGQASLIKVSKKDIFKKYRRILNYGFHIMIGSFLIFLLTASGRIMVEYFFDYETVAAYSFYFRMSAVVVMVYQMVSVLYFSKLYTVNPILLDKYYSMFFLGIALLSVGCFLIAPMVLSEWSEFFRNTAESYKEVYFLISIQMVMWIATALNSSIVDRENLASKNNIWLLTLIIAGILVLMFNRSSLDMPKLVFIHLTIIFIAAQIQYFTLKKKNISFKRSGIVLLTLYIFVSVFYFTGIY